MKIKTFLLAIVIVIMLLPTACGKDNTSSGSSTNKSDNNKSSLYNPVTEITMEKAKELYPSLFRVPDGASNTRWAVIDSDQSSGKNNDKLLEFTFDLDGKSFTAREIRSASTKEDFSGLYYEWSAKDSFDFVDTNGNKLSGEAFRYNGKTECVDLCIWHDPYNDMSYTLSVSAESLDGFDLQAIVERITP